MKKHRQETGSAQFNIIMLIVFIVFAAGAYFAFSAYQANQERSAHEEALKKEEARKQNEEIQLANERKKIAAENAEKKKAFDSAVAFARANLEKPQAALKKLTEAAEKLTGTEYETLVNLEIENVKTAISENSQERKKEISDKISELEKETAAMAEKKQYRKAILFLNDYDGKFKKETESKRATLALQYEKRQKEYQKQEDKAEKIIAGISSIIADGKFQEAYEKLETVSSDKALEPYKNEIAALKKSLDTVKNTDKALQAYFESKMNKETSIKTGKQNFSGTVTSVNKTTVELKIKMGKALASKKIPYSTIPADEKMRILKEIDETASTLMQYAAAIKKGDMKMVADCNFSTAGTFGKQLDQHIQNKISTAEAEENKKKDKSAKAKDEDEENKKKDKSAKAKDEDEDDPAPTAIDSKILKGLKVKAIVQKPSSKGMDYDDKFQTIKSRISISNESLADVSGLEGEIYIIGKSVSGTKDYRLFKIAKTAGISILKGKKYLSDEYTCKVQYDSNLWMKFGHKYEGYLLVLKDNAGEILMKKGNPAKFDRAADKIMKLEENSLFDDDGNFIEMYRYNY